MQQRTVFIHPIVPIFAGRRPTSFKFALTALRSV